MGNSDYIARCREATTEQGLDPAVEALVAAKVPHSVEQTGGMVMLITAYAFPAEPTSEWVGVSFEEGYVIMAYDGPDDEGRVIVSDAAADEVPDYVRGFLHGAQRRREAIRQQVEANEALGREPRAGGG